MIVLLIVFFSGATAAIAVAGNHNGSSVPNIEFPDHATFNSGADCSDHTQPKPPPQQQPVKLHLRRHRAGSDSPRDSVVSSTTRDLSRIQILHRRISEKKNKIKSTDANNQNHQNHHRSLSSSPAPSPEPPREDQTNPMMIATLESGVGFGSGEYFMDVFIGTPPRHLSLILDTGSDLNWIQCEPCLDCFEQSGPIYDPSASSSYRNITCSDSRCSLVSPPADHRDCRRNLPCPYYYWYGDSSNTTGDFATESFTVNLTTSATSSSSPSAKRVEGVMFGCGHWNRGLFRGAAGLLGLGRGPLSFSSQLQSLYGQSFSYCLVERESDTNVTSNLIFGSDGNDPKRNHTFTALVPGETFYYVAIKSILVGGKALEIPEDTWRLKEVDGSGGTIIDSGTTLSYFVEPAYAAIEAAFVKAAAAKRYRRTVVEDLPLEVCYNVTGVEEMELPEFAIEFADGAVWDFPMGNYLIRVEPQEVICLALKSASGSGMNIIGNYQQQNFHVLYDTKNSRLGYAPANCADEALR